MNSTTISIVLVGLLIGGVILYTRPSASTNTVQNTVAVVATNNVTAEDVPQQKETPNDASTATAIINTPTDKDIVPKPKEQVVEILAKGGYTPKISQARPDMPTILRMKTQSTYDCSSSVNIPSLNIRKILPPDGATDIALPPQKLGTSLTVLCGMGMYNTIINFN